MFLMKTINFDSSAGSCIGGLSHSVRKGSLRFTLAGLLLATLGIGAALGAGDVWKKKPYTQWSEAEALGVMADSPWAKSVPLLTAMSLNDNPGGAPRGAEGVEVKDLPQRPSDSRAKSAAAEPPVFFVRWASAVTFRQAVIRVQQLRGNVSPEQAAEFLNRKPDNYELMVTGPALKVFLGKDEQWLRDNFHLKLKPANAVIHPAAIQFLRAPGTENLQAVTLLFPRLNKDGASTFPSGTEKADLGCRTEQGDLSATFDLRKMQSSGHPDL